MTDPPSTSSTPTPRLFRVITATPYGTHHFTIYVYANDPRRAITSALELAGPCRKLVSCSPEGEW